MLHNIDRFGGRLIYSWASWVGQALSEPFTTRVSRHWSPEVAISCGREADVLNGCTSRPADLRRGATRWAGQWRGKGVDSVPAAVETSRGR